MKSILTRLKTDLQEQKTPCSALENYNVYFPNTNEKLKYYSFSSALLFSTGLLFYRNILMASLLCLLSLVLKRYWLKYKIKKRQEALSEQFRDVLYSISGSVASGRQLPTAIEDACEICEKMYGEESDIARELALIVKVSRQSNAKSIDLLSDFAQRSNVDEIKQFALALNICSHSGGDIEGVCLRSSKLLLDKIDFQNEILTLISQKKTDIFLLTSMPIVILLYLNLTNFEYIAILYSGLLGRCIMTLCLLMIGTALVWGLRIIDLKL